MVVVTTVAVTVAGPSAIPADAADSMPVSVAPDYPLATTVTHPVDEGMPPGTDATDPEWLDPEVTVPAPGIVDVDVPATGWVRAGSFPLSVAQASTGSSPARVRVRMLSQAETTAAGGRFLGFELVRADRGAGTGVVAVSLDYTGIERAFGGDFASRLRLVRGSDCVADTPCVRRPVAARNYHDTRMLRGNVSVRPDPAASVAGGDDTIGSADSGFGAQPIGDDAAMLSAPSALTSATYVASAPSNGPAGDYRTSALSAASRWSVGVGSGVFTYSYPIAVPPSVAGAAPSLAINYSSQTVDGRTVSSNGQAPKVGEGWDFEPGFIERRFKACGGTGAIAADLCWSSHNEYILHFGGHTGELLRVGSSNEWRLRGNDPGWLIRSFTGADNADNDGEYFQVVTSDGTKYWFGYGTEPRNNPTLYTSGAYEVPVYGGVGEPCYNAVTSLSWCQQTYRWNVDRVLDTNNNVMSYFYTKERNKYARQATSALATPYVRAGFLKRIEYGQRNGAEDDTAHARVLVTTQARCVSQTPTCPTPTSSSSPDSYPDVPLDLLCSTTATSCDATLSSPTFWSTQQISSIATEFWYGALTTPAYEPVSTFSMEYSFPPTGDTTTPSLWLQSIKHTGEYGTGSTEMPAARFYGYDPLPNRVNSGTGVPALNKYRVKTINTELGAQLVVTYGQPHPCVANTALVPNTNATDCYPALYNGDWIPFRKYLVTDLLVKDVRGDGPDTHTTYTYNDAPAWHHDDSLLTDDDKQSWTDYRGHADVRVRVSGSGSTSGTDTRYLTFRGMYGDKLTATTAKTGPNEDLTDSTGTVYNDYDYRAGLPLEVQQFDSSDVLVASEIHRYWSVQLVDGPDKFQSHDSDYVRESRTVRRVKNTAAPVAWREQVTDRTYSPTFGTLLTTSEDGDAATLSDDTCTKLGYTQNTTAWITDKPYRTMTYDGSCGSNSTTKIAQTEFVYDGNASLTDPAVKGNATEMRNFINATDSAVTRTGYDSMGRVTSVISPNEVANGTNGATTTTYAPTSGYPHDGITTSTPPPTTAPGTVGQSTKTLLWFAWGVPRRVTDANGWSTTFSVDHLGRTTAVTLPTDTTLPSVKFEYELVSGGRNLITTSRLVNDTSYLKSYDYFDGYGRPIQTQLPPANDGGTGRRLIMTRYDALGQKAAETEPFGATGIAGAGLADVALTDIRRETRFGYDALGRLYRTAHYAAGVLQHATDVTHYGWRHTVHGRDRAASDLPKLNDVDYHTDVFGRTAKVSNYNDAGTALHTEYTHTATGELSSIEDAGTNVTTYGYDWLGRRTFSSDPDQGSWAMTYDPDGNLKSVRDALQAYVLYDYDRLSRKIRAQSKPTATATPTMLSEWAYDDNAVTNSEGRMTKATHFTDGLPYATAVGSYDELGHATSKTVTVPTTPGDATSPRNSIAGNYTFGYIYNKAGAVASVTMPAVPGVAAMTQEKVTTDYNAAGLPVALKETLPNGTAGARYYSAAQYYNNGQIQERLLRSDTMRRTYEYNAGNGLVSQIIAQTRPTDPAPQVYEHYEYTYDSDQNVTSVTDRATGGIQQRECFRHDKLNRLRKAFTTSAGGICSDETYMAAGPGPYSQTYTYNDIGDMTSLSDAGVTTTYTYGDPLHAHAVMKTWTTTQPAAPTHEYDLNGATTKRTSQLGVQDLTWTPLHQLKAVQGPGATSYVYDADGAKLIRDTSTTSTLYLDGMEVSAQLDATTSTVKKSATRYYGSFAMRTAEEGGAAQITTLLRNYQNSASTLVNGTTVSRQRFTPYGKRRGGQLTGTDRSFLDKIEDLTGLTALGARDYDTRLARFISVDPLADLTTPQTLASYSYAKNNPTTFVDPTGMLADPSPGGGCATTCPRPETNPTPTPSPTPPPPPSGGSGGGGFDPFAIYRTVMEQTIGRIPVQGTLVMAAIDDGNDCFANGKGWACVRTALVVVGEGGAAVAAGARAYRAYRAARVAEAIGAESATIVARIPFGPAPEKAVKVLERVMSKGSPLPGYKGGSVFRNSARRLPDADQAGNPITYREWDINPHIRGVDRGPERMVTGSDGSAYYTADHYNSFLQFSGQGS